MKLLLGAAVLLAAALAGADDTAVEVLTVRNRPASDLVQVLEPLVGSDGSVAALENRLIVRATPAALRRIKEALPALDVAPRSLWVTVRQASTAVAQAQGGSVTAIVPAGGATVEVRPDGTTVTTTQRSRTRITGGFGATSVNETGSDLQHLQCLEGRPAFIRAGRAVPVAIVGGATYAEADTGFWVLPRLAGDLVTLELAVSKDAFESAGTVGVRQAQTTVSGRLGEWLAVSGSALARDAAERGIASRGSARQSSDWSVDLKVDAASE
ncbi:MAG TPA: secretin N-terminal domain-containing protein [Vicinamibacteria bacterium]|nr:secretin N-terminal domain-containing protein [Vicinamibacteria bacterium]